MHGNAAHVVRAHGAITARSSRGRRHGDALDGSAVGSGQQQSVADEHRWGPGVAPGMKIGGGAHPIGGASGGSGTARRGGGRRRWRGHGGRRRRGPSSAPWGGRE
jgi:hypothetical protein